MLPQTPMQCDTMLIMKPKRIQRVNIALWPAGPLCHLRLLGSFLVFLFFLLLFFFLLLLCLFLLLPPFFFLLPQCFLRLLPYLNVGVPLVPIKVSVDQRGLFVLIRQDLVITIWYLRHDTLEDCLAQRIQLVGAVVMVVLAAPDTGLIVRMCFRETGDVDEETITDVDPPGINDVHTVAALALPDPWVDVEKVGPFYLPVIRDIVVVCLVVGFAEVVEGRAAHLGVEVKVPGQSLQ